MKRLVVASLIVVLIVSFAYRIDKNDVPAWSVHAGQAITVTEAMAMTNNFSESTKLAGRVYSKQVLLDQLSNESVHGVRIYPGKDGNKPCFVLVPVDRLGQDILDGSAMIVERGGESCPPDCGVVF